MLLTFLITYNTRQFSLNTQYSPQYLFCWYKKIALLLGYLSYNFSLLHFIQNVNTSEIKNNYIIHFLFRANLVIAKS